MSFSSRITEDNPQAPPEFLIKGNGQVSLYAPERLHAERVIQSLKAESEVMPSEQANSCTNRPDTWPLSATGADGLDAIATLLRSLTYGEMMELAAGIWKLKPDGKELDNTTLPETIHKWAQL